MANIQHSGHKVAPVRKARTISPEKREAMFHSWRLGAHNKADVAKEFKVNYYTVVRIAQADNWPEREKEVVEKARQIANEKTAKHEFDRVAKVRECLKHEIEAYLARVKAGEIQGSLSTIIQAMRYLDEREGIAPIEGATKLEVELHAYLTPSPATPEEDKQRRLNLAEILSDSDFGG